MSSIKCTFSPGPSQLSDKILHAITEVAESGFLSASHRGEWFSEVSRSAIQGVRGRLGIPSEYHIFYQPSATSCMEAILRNCARKKSFHFVQGAFSLRCLKTANAIGLQTASMEEDPQEAVPWQEAKIAPDTEVIAVTHCETSTGAIWPDAELRALRDAHRGPLLAIDTTSTMAGLNLPWEAADIWYASVQKCFGLPAGLALLVVNPRAFEIAKEAQGVAPWQRFDVMASKMDSYQTLETPNLFDIALLARQIEDWDMPTIEEAIHRKAKKVYAQSYWGPYIHNPLWRSPTVANFLVDQPRRWHEHALQEGYQLGGGYGRLRDSCIRLALFPAIEEETVDAILDCLSRFFR